MLHICRLMRAHFKKFMSLQDMPRVQLIILWVGLVGDIITKGSLTFQLIHLAMRHMWVNFGVILGGYVVSSSFVSPSAYRLTAHTACC